MPEPSLELLQTLMERMLEQQREITCRLVAIERRLAPVDEASNAARLMLLGLPPHF